MKFIDNFLNQITMYRLVLYGLGLLAMLSIALSYFGLIAYSAFSLSISLLLLVGVSYVTNFLFAKFFLAERNVESVYITSLILFFIMLPVTSFPDAYAIAFVATLAMASKYIFAIGKKHIFNPVAIAIVILELFGNGNAFWWVATPILILPTLILGFLIIKKLRRISLFLAFTITSIVILLYPAFSSGTDVIEILRTNLLSGPLLFFGFIMLTEPLTTPPTRRLQIIYAIIVGLLFSFQYKIGPLFSNPVLALVIGNIFSYLVSSKKKLRLSFVSMKPLSSGIYDFSFLPDKRLAFQPGQYLEWTLSHPRSDDRGNRRFFTIASSPTERELRLGVRINKGDSSSFKRKMLDLKKGNILMAGNLAGEFVLPDDVNEKLVFIAGGIGITPFRSMIKYLADLKQQRDIILLYSSLKPTEYAYAEEFETLKKDVGMKIVYIVTDPKNVPPDWIGKTGFITHDLIKEEISDFADRKFYLSGPNAMVRSYKKLLLGMGIKKKNILTDYFPGF